MKAPKTELRSSLQLSAKPPTAQDTATLAVLPAKHPAGLPAKALWGASGLESDAFYQQLKTEMARDWIVQPEPASVREVAAS